MREIILFPRVGTWHAEHVGDRGVFDLFGTTVLPTPFSSLVAAEDVVRVIEERNPGASVDHFDTEAAWAEDVHRGDTDAAYMTGQQCCVLGSH